MKAGGSELKELRVITSFLAELPVVEQVGFVFPSSEDATTSLTPLDLVHFRDFMGNGPLRLIGRGRTRFEKSAGFWKESSRSVTHGESTVSLSKRSDR